MKPAKFLVLLSLASWSGCVSAVKAESGAATDTATADSRQKLIESYNKMLSKAEKDNRFAGTSVVLFDKNGEFYRAHFGYSDVQNQKKPTDNTIYELASVTKVFTRLLLNLETDVQWTDPISKYLPPQIQNPEPAGQSIRMQDLALHTGFRFSLPCVLQENSNFEMKCFGMPNLWDPKNANVTDPYAHTTRESLHEFVDAYAKMLQRPDVKWAFAAPGRLFEYSNAGTGLLGELLALKNQTTYSEYVKKKILAPLGMNHTFADMNCSVKFQPECAELAKVYARNAQDSAWVEQSVWHFPGFAGAGGIRSNISDMSLFLKAQMEQNAALPDALKRGILRGKLPLPEVDAEHATNICGTAGAEEKFCNKSKENFYRGFVSDRNLKTFWHNGATDGSNSMILFSADGSFGAVVLANNGYRPKTKSATHFPQNFANCAYAMTLDEKLGREYCAEYL